MKTSHRTIAALVGAASLAATASALRAAEPCPTQCATGKVPLGVAVLRLVTAMLLGGIIGWEREVNARAAGLRTHMLISLAAATFAGSVTAVARTVELVERVGVGGFVFGGLVFACLGDGGFRVGGFRGRCLGRLVPGPGRGKGRAACLGRVQHEDRLARAGAELHRLRHLVREEPGDGQHDRHEHVVAETVEHIVRGTMYGPTLRRPFSRMMSEVASCHSGEPPPLPAISPTRGERSDSGSMPPSAIALRIDT